MDFQTLHGQVIEFTNEVSETEIDFDKGMKARVIGVYNDGYDYIILTCDFSDFEEENKKFAQANYYDDNQHPTLCWHETKSYPDDKKVQVFVDSDTDKYPPPFKVLGGAYPTTAQCLDALEKTLVALMSPSRPLWHGDLDNVCLEVQEILQNAGRSGTISQLGPSISLMVSMNTDDDCQLEYMGDLFCLYGDDLLISKSGFATVQVVTVIKNTPFTFFCPRRNHD